MATHTAIAAASGHHTDAVVTTANSGLAPPAVKER